MPCNPPCAPQLSSKLEAVHGAEAVSQLLSQLDAEWQHLKRLRQKYVGGPGAASAASPSPPRSQVGRAPMLKRGCAANHTMRPHWQQDRGWLVRW